MEKISIALGAIVMSMLMIFFVATFSGTVLFFLYPHIHALFPTAAANGIIAVKLNWWDAVCICWIFSILFKASSSSSSKK